MRYIDSRKVWIAEDAVVRGDVALGAECSVWHHVVIRGDVAPIRVGRRVNIQDHSILHCHSGVPLEIGDDVAIGHHAVVHCRRVGTRCLIGIRAVVLDGAEIGDGAIVAAGSVVTPGTRVPPGMVVMGTPARVVRPVSDAERHYIAATVETYIDLARRHGAGEFAALA